MPLVPPATPYAVLADLTTYGAPAGAFATLTTPQQQGAVDAANQLADDYLSRRYALPLSTWGVDLVQKIATIAAYEAIVVRGANPEAPGVADLHARWEAAIKWLEGIADGTITPPAIAGNPTATGSGATGGEGEFVASVSSDATGRFVVGRPVSGRGW